MDQGTPHKTRDSETYRRESGGTSQIHGHRGNFPEETTNGLSKIKNQQIGPHKIAKLL